MKYPQGCIMVFCKAPEPGKVMTRLAEGLDEMGLDGGVVAARIHEFLTIERLHKATQDALSPVQLWCSPDKQHPFFRECENHFPLVLKEQFQGDLGERMYLAFEDALSSHPYAILIGTDCPELDGVILDQAFQSLNSRQCSVIGPAEDGGYVLIGLSNQQAEIFHNIEWGSARVCDETLQRLSGEVELLPRLWDLDRIEDLQRLIDESNELNLRSDFIDYLHSIKLRARLN